MDLLNTKYCATWDAFYNGDTREWKEKACLDPACKFCVGRPKKHRKNCARCYIDEQHNKKCELPEEEC